MIYLISQTVISFILLAALASLKTAPPRIKFFLTMSGILIWLLPVHRMSAPFPTTLNKAPPFQLISLADRALPTTGPFLDEGGYQAPPLVFWVLIVACLLFCRDLIQARKFLINLRQNERDGSALWRRMPFSPKSRPPIKLVEGDEALVTGVFWPEIYLGERYLDSPALKYLVFHEYVHARRGDNAWLWLIQLCHRLFWWNPLVLFLTHNARRYLEMSCDQTCKDFFEGDRYQVHLAETLLSASARMTHTYAGSIHSTRFNVTRIQSLSRHYRLSMVHRLVIVFCILGVLTIAVHPVFSNPPKKQQTLPDDHPAKPYVVTLSAPKYDLEGESKGFELNNGEFKGFELSNIDVKDGSLHDLLRFIADNVGINLYLDATVEDKKVTYRFRNIPWDKLLFIVIKDAGYSYYYNGSLWIGKERTMIQFVADVSKFPQYTGTKIEKIEVDNISVTELIHTLASQAGIEVRCEESIKPIKATYRFVNIPWDQAMDIILINANLAFQNSGKRLWVGTKADAASEKRQDPYPDQVSF